MLFGQFYFLGPYFWLIDVQTETRDECPTMTGILPLALQFGV
ncbi:MAG: hypothetical protein ACI9EZ_001435 [Halobacteriales archaeon]